MAKIIAITIPISGHLFPFMPLLEELRRRGHSVSLVWCAPQPVARTFAGFEVHHQFWPISTAPVNIAPPRFPWQQSTEAFAVQGEPIVNASIETIARNKPDALLIDPKLWGATIAADASQTPWASLAHNPLMFSGLGLDPRGPGWPPQTSSRVTRRYQLLDRYIRDATQPQLRLLNAARQRFGLPAFESIAKQLVSAPLILATTAEPFEYPRTDWPETLCFVGPLNWSLPAPIQYAPPDATLRPVVLVSGSSIPADGRYSRWAEMVVRALLAHGGFHIVATLPTEPLPTLLRTQIQTYNALPHDLVLPHVDCVVCHGGPGIAHKALWHGKPVVAIPFAYDRFEIARRTEFSAAGVALHVERLSPDAVVKAVRGALACSAGAESLGRVFRQSGGATGACDQIERRLLNTKRVRTEAGSVT